MGVEVRPLGVRCNIQCTYCYQNNERMVAGRGIQYDLNAIKAAIHKANREFSLFGGEPLLIPLNDMEELFAYGLQKFGKNGIQTNGTLISDKHIALFKKYKVSVGISVDGPDDLNDLRWQGSLRSTRIATAKTHESIRRLCQEGVQPGLIVTLHRVNSNPDALPRMHSWVRGLSTLGIRSMRLHFLEVESEDARAEFGLQPDEAYAAMLGFLELEPSLGGLQFDIFRDMRNLLRGEDEKSTCVWQACDPYTTKAVQGIEGHGQSSNCGRTNKDGIGFTKGTREGFERYMALYSTPQEHGGCHGCRFFLMCKGECPGTAL